MNQPQECLACRHSFRGVRGLSLHLRKNRTCDLHYASLDGVADHRHVAPTPVVTAPARQSQASTVARIPLLTGQGDNEFTCWDDDDASVSAPPARVATLLPDHRKHFTPRVRTRAARKRHSLSISAKTMEDEQSVCASDSDSVASVKKAGLRPLVRLGAASRVPLIVPHSSDLPVPDVPPDVTAGMRARSGWDVDGITARDAQTPDTSVLQLNLELQKLQSDEFGLDRYSLEDKMQLELLHILKSHRLPLNTFAPTLAFAIKLNTLGVSLEHAPRTRKTIIAKLFKHYNMEALAPQEKPCTLPISRKTVMVVFFNAHAVFASLLSCPFLNQDHKYMFPDPHNIFAPPRSDQDDVGDINTGAMYHATYAELVVDPMKDMLFPVVMGLDKTHIDSSSRLHMEPLYVLHGLLKHKFRSQPSAMRILGYINLSHVYYKASQLPMTGLTRMSVAAAKLNDYHAQIEFILRESGYVQLQNQGFDWILQFRGEQFPVTFRTYVPFIIGDTEGHDRLCGHYTARFENIQQLCRVCKCPSALSSYSKGVYQKRTPRELLTLLTSHNDAGFRAFSQSYLLRNGFDQLQFGFRPGTKPSRGIFGACPAEILHLLLLGWFKYCIEAFVVQLGGVKSVKVAMFDNLCAEIGERLQRQSDRDVPRTNFPKGFSTIANLKGHEIVGCLVVMLFAIQTSNFRSIVSAKQQDQPGKLGDPQHVADWILLLESLLQWHQWLKEPNMTKKIVRRSVKSLQWLMRLFQKVAPRDTGMEYNLIKMHLVLHIHEDILDHGVPQNVNSAFTESAHISMAKHTARNTQKRRSSFTYQAAKRYVENLALDLAFYETGRQPLHSIINVVPVNEERATGLFIVSALALPGAGNMELQYHWHNTARQREQTAGVLKHSCVLSAFLVSYFFERMPPGFNLHCYTEYATVIETENPTLQLFRTQPLYQCRPWYDCALMAIRKAQLRRGTNNQNTIDVPARLHVFLDLRNPDTCHGLNTVLPEHAANPIVPGFYVICEMYDKAPAAVIDNDETSASIIGIYHRVNTDNGTPKLFLMSTQELVEPMFGMPDIAPNVLDQKKPSSRRSRHANRHAAPTVPYYLFFDKPRHMWAQSWENRIMMRKSRDDEATTEEEGDRLRDEQLLV